MRAISALGFEVSQSENSDFLQKKQEPHAMVKGMTTRSPGVRLVTALPTSTTTPMGSWPRMSPDSMVGM